METVIFCNGTLCVVHLHDDECANSLCGAGQRGHLEPDTVFDFAFIFAFLYYKTIGFLCGVLFEVRFVFCL